MSFLNGISNLSKLGSLPACLKKKIKDNKKPLERALQKSKLNGLGYVTNVIPFSQVVKQYNVGISGDEIRAWVWYRRKNHIPMSGWDDYYLKGNEQRELKRLVKAGVLFYLKGKLLPYPGQCRVNAQMMYKSKLLVDFCKVKKSKHSHSYVNLFIAKQNQSRVRLGASFGR